MKKFLQLIAITLFAGILLIAIPVAIYLQQHYFSIPLHAYVCHQLEPAALEFQNADYPHSLSLLQQVRPQHAYVEAERRYLMALCLQASGHYLESIVHYTYVQQSDSDNDLKLRAFMGDALARANIPYITDAQLYFPDTATALNAP